MATAYPPSITFARPPITKVGDYDNRIGGYQETEYLKSYYPYTGGSFVITADKPYHRKGHSFPEAVQLNNIVKRLSLMLVLPFVPSKKKFLERLLYHFVRMAMSVYDSGIRNPILKHLHYNKLPKELWRLVYWFLLSWGIDKSVANDVGCIVATLIQYDDAYYIRLADLFAESSKQRLLANPRKEILRLSKIYLQREKYVGKNSTQQRVMGIVKAISYLLYLPKVRQCLKLALQGVNFGNLQLDEADRYFALNHPEYDVCGLTSDVRKAEFEQLRQAHINKVLSQLGQL